MTRKTKFTPEVVDLIKKNLDLVPRKLAPFIKEKLGDGPSYEAIRVYIKDNNLSKLVKKVVIDNKKSPSTIIVKKPNLPQNPQNKKFIKFPATSNQLIELLKKKQGEGKADYLLRQYEGPGRNKTLLMHTIEFVIDHFK